MQIPPFKLERFFAKYEFSAPYLLSSSDCESLSVKDLLDLEPGSLQSFQDHWLGYTESQGDPALRQEISALYEQISADQVLVHAGAEEAIFNFMNSMLGPGDHLIVHFPCYQSLLEVANSLGCQVTRWTVAEQDGWALDPDFLRENIKTNTKGIVLNCPHNPTGYLMSAEKIQAVIDIARQNDLFVFSDEVYRGLEYNQDDRLPAACDLYEQAISLGVMSKTYGLAGLRIGWIATRDQSIYEAMAAFKDYTTICNSAPSEFLATLALRNKEKIVQRNLAIVHHNLSLLDDFFAAYDEIFAWIRPGAGSIAFPSLTGDRDVEIFCLDLIEQEGVLLLPSTYFDYGVRNFRIGFGRKNMPEALGRLEAYVKRHYQ